MELAHEDMLPASPPTPLLFQSVNHSSQDAQPFPVETRQSTAVTKAADRPLQSWAQVRARTDVFTICYRRGEARHRELPGGGRKGLAGRTGQGASIWAGRSRGRYELCRSCSGKWLLFLWPIFKINFYLGVCLHSCTCGCHGAFVEVRGQFWQVESLFPL